jgi:Ca2+-binding RTX toxin-like protein
MVMTSILAATTPTRCLTGTASTRYALGGGDDLYIAVAGLIQDGVDVLDGGLNGTRGDTYDASSLGILMGINLDTVDHTEFSAFVAKGVATGASFNDSIKGFENAKGGSNADAIFGNAVANVLEGNNGSDLLHGYAGNDTLRGGAGSDLLQGGAGKDILEGGQDADRFVFTKLTDSGPLATERDRITDFVHGTDKIVMEHLDSDETVAGEQNGFAFIGMNAAFTGVEGQVRAIHVGTTATNGYTLVQADIDGDRRSEIHHPVDRNHHPEFSRLRFPALGRVVPLSPFHQSHIESGTQACHCFPQPDGDHVAMS